MMPQVTMDEINADPKKAGITYQRHECQRCHIGVRGRERRGDFRGMGCSACHVLYGTDGFYMGEAELWKKVSTEGTIDPKGHLEAMNKMIKFMAEQGVKPAELKE